MAGEIECASCGMHLLDALDDVEDVGARLAADDQHDRALAVGPAGDALVLDAVDDVRDVAEAHRRAATCS